MCSNLVLMPMEMIDGAVLGAIDDILTPELVDEVLSRLREVLDVQAVADPRSPVEAELTAVETQLEHLTETIALAGNMPVSSINSAALRRTASRLSRCSRRSRQLSSAHRWIEAPSSARRDVLRQWRELLGEDVGAARRVLRELLKGPLRFTPIVDGTRRGYRFEGALTVGGMLAGAVRSNGWRPRTEPRQTTPWRIPFADEIMLAA